jgi:hypothetical protein
MKSPYLHLLKQSTAAVRATLRNVRHQVPAIALAGVASLSLFTACMEDTFPSGMYTQEQLNQSPKAKEGAFWAIPSSIVQPTGSHWQFGWGTVMHARDVMTGDMTKPYLDYDHFNTFSEVIYLGQDYNLVNTLYMAYYDVILAANTSIKGYVANEANLSDAEKGFLGASYAFRALSYLELASMFEFLPNEFFPDGRNAQGNVVTNLTVPIVTEAVSQKDSYNNPRATHKQMFDFILSDLDKAEANIDKLAVTTKDVPHLDVVYGLKARLYLWDGQYDKAAEFARKAINAHSGAPLTQAEWVDPIAGFNSPNVGSWMLSASINKETLGSRYNLSNWTGWMAPESQFGYAGLGGVFPFIDRSLYDKIADTDFRKLSFKAPKGHALEGKTPYIDKKVGAALPAYTGVKFRSGQGNIANYSVGAACSYPLMRVEEMYLIEAEAAAHTDGAKGAALLNTFMKTYRDANYNCTLSNSDEVVQEVVLQKRIELWGEGRTFFDIKRLNMSVTRAYEGTNVPEEVRYNTNGRPAWMNIVLPKFEGVYNTPVYNYNNPDPSGKYSPVK